VKDVLINCTALQASPIWLARYSAALTLSRRARRSWCCRGRRRRRTKCGRCWSRWGALSWVSDVGSSVMRDACVTLLKYSTVQVTDSRNNPQCFTCCGNEVRCRSR